MDEVQSEHVLPVAAGVVLVQLARRGLERFVSEGLDYRPDLTALPAILTRNGCCFVTLTEQGRLRGCMGHTEPQDPLAVDVIANAIAAASRDPRFAPLRATELANVHLEVTVLGPMRQVVFDDYDNLIGQLRPRVDGVLLKQGQRQALLLPQVWHRIAQPAEFLNVLAYKAGLPSRLLWVTPPAYTVMVFQAQTFAEPGYREPE
ncbi:MAG: AmmeMemoRadiSam system protein A [Candidatus Promineifilaceae bacterium]|nr:AmmeMemoRadiSam system protein A [Candidatus Promineifilaceae bacterium]